jgi:hypothetical protein
VHGSLHSSTKAAQRPDPTAHDLFFFKKYLLRQE